MTGDGVRAVVFPYRFNGYSPHHVDLFLHNLADLLDAGQVTESDFQHDGFPKVMRGYDVGVVDQFIVSLARGTPMAARLTDAAGKGGTRRPREPVPAKLKQANAASQVYYHSSHNRRDAPFRDQYRQESDDNWADFYAVSGTRLTLTSSRIHGDDGVLLMTRRRKTWTEISGGCAFRFTLRADVVDVSAGDQILSFSGDHRAYYAAARVRRRQEPWLWFPVRGTSLANAVMTAIDRSGTEVMRFRRARTGETQVVVSPDHAVTPDILCVIAAAGPLLGRYFTQAARAEMSPIQATRPGRMAARIFRR